MIVSRVRAFRYYKGITQKELSEATGLCINTIRHVESQEYVNLHIPKYTVMTKIAKVLDIEKEKLLFKIDV